MAPSTGNGSSSASGSSPDPQRHAVPLSVVMPCFNVAPYLDDSVKSILDQSFADYEFIAIDDGSTDDTLAILQRWAARDTRLRVVHQANAGVAVARNRGIAESSGAFIAAMDPDDIALPDRFSMQIEFLTQHPEVSVVGAAVIQIDEWGNEIRTQYMSADHDTLVRDLLRGHGGVITQPVAMFRRDSVLQAGCYDPRFPGTEDLDLFLRLSETGRITNLPVALVKYRQHPKSINRTQITKRRMHQEVIITEARRRRGLPPAGPQDIDYATAEPETKFRLDTARALRTRRAYGPALKHALRAIRLSPLSLSPWATLARFMVPPGWMTWLRGHS